MSPQPPRPSQLANVEVPLRVTVVRADWDAIGSALENAVRDYCVRWLREAPLVHSVRRDGK